MRLAWQVVGALVVALVISGAYAVTMEGVATSISQREALVNEKATNKKLLTKVDNLESQIDGLVDLYEDQGIEVPEELQPARSSTTRIITPSNDDDDDDGGSERSSTTIVQSPGNSGSNSDSSDSSDSDSGDSGNSPGIEKQVEDVTDTVDKVKDDAVGMVNEGIGIGLPLP